MVVTHDFSILHDHDSQAPIDQVEFLLNGKNSKGGSSLPFELKKMFYAFIS
jgi:hypothetical protein